MKKKSRDNELDATPVPDGFSCAADVGGHFVPALENLEARRLFSSAAQFYVQTNLVSDTPSVPALSQDANLKNPWGIAFAPAGEFWVADNATGVATLYNSTGAALSLVVTVPPPTGAAGPAAPTGQLYNGTSGFQVSSGGATAPAQFIFVTEDGTISGWSPSVDSTHAILTVDHSASGTVYKGAAFAKVGKSTLLYATDFHGGKIDVYNSNFAQVNGTTISSKAFRDAGLKPGYAPFNIANVNGDLFVTYALQNAAKHDDVAGPRHGYIDEFTPTGALVRRIASFGSLDSPWGMAVAPATFGKFAGDLLVGNFGNGEISAFNLKTRAFDGLLTGSDGSPIHQDGLWALQFGNGHAGGDSGTLFFTAGPNDESDGVFGELAPGHHHHH